MASHQSYGSRRLVTAMENQGIRIGRYKVRSLMRKSALKPVWKRKFIHTTNSKHDLPIAGSRIIGHICSQDSGVNSGFHSRP